MNTAYMEYRYSRLLVLRFNAIGMDLLSACVAYFAAK